MYKLSDFFLSHRNNASLPNCTSRNTNAIATMFAAMARKYGIGCSKCHTGNTVVLYHGKYLHKSTICDYFIFWRKETAYVGFFFLLFSFTQTQVAEISGMALAQQKQPKWFWIIFFISRPNIRMRIHGKSKKYGAPYANIGQIISKSFYGI